MATRFALRRLSGDRVLAILTSRPHGPVESDEGWRRRWEAGETIPVIARAIGATRTGVRRAMDRNGIDRRRRP